jgi:hypothetical protein
MPDSKLTFWGFVCLWWSAATKGAMDRIGFLSLVVGALLWWWRKYYTASFDVAVGYLGISPDAAMTDLVWQVPIGLGCLALGWRFLRAPYEIHLAEVQKRASLETLINESAQFKLSIESGGYYIAASKPGDSCVLPGVWLVYYDVVITNHSEKQVPLELWLHVGMKADGSWRFGEVCEPVVPMWAVEPAVEDDEGFERLVNLPGLSAKTGYCATNLGHDVIATAGVVDEKELAEQRPFWLEVKNKLTNESKSHPMNYIARNVDRARTGG